MSIWTTIKSWFERKNEKTMSKPEPLLGETTGTQNFIITTKSGNTYTIQRFRGKEWYVFVDDERCPILSIGSSRAEDVKRITGLQGQSIKYLNPHDKVSKTSRIQDIKAA